MGSEINVVEKNLCVLSKLHGRLQHMKAAFGGFQKDIEETLGVEDSFEPPHDESRKRHREGNDPDSN